MFSSGYFGCSGAQHSNFLSDSSGRLRCGHTREDLRFLFPVSLPSGDHLCRRSAEGHHPCCCHLDSWLSWYSFFSKIFQLLFFFCFTIGYSPHTPPPWCAQSESIIVAKHYAAKYNYPVSPNRELVALGLANIVGSFVLAMPSFGSLTRSAVSDAAGNFCNQSTFSIIL